MLKISIVFAVLAALVSFTAQARSNEPSETAAITDERRAAFASEDFDACTLKTPEETWAYWDAVLSDDDKTKVRSTPYGDLIMYHHGWGMGIRNSFCLWRGGPLQNWFKERGVDHPDSMSQILIELYWARLNGCNPDIDAFARTDYPPDPELLHCPAEIDLSVPDYMKEPAREEGH